MTIWGSRPHHAIWPKRLPRELVLPETSLWFNLEVTATRYAQRAVTHFFGQAMTYAQLHQQATALAGWLQAKGVGKGDRVIVFLQNCPQYIVAVHAILRADAVVVPVNPMNKADEFGHYITDSGAKACITSADLAAVVAEADGRLPADKRLSHLLVTRFTDAMPAGDLDPELTPAEPILQWLRSDPPLPAGATRWPDALTAGHAPGPHTAQPDDMALLPYTSGTTGLPKGCIHTHRSLMHNVVGGGVWGHAGPETVSLAVVPMFHITGFVYCALGVAANGSTAVVLPRWDRELVGRMFSRYRISHWTCIPTMVIDLFASPNIHRFDLSSLRYLSGGGAAMPAAVAERLKNEFGIVFAEGYGLTETAAPTHANLPERAKPQCLGIPIFGTDALVIDPEMLTPMPPGEVGEIVSSGPMLFKGYWGHPEATRAAFIQIEGRSYFRTGDLGRMDEEGYFFLTDRLKRMINASGYKVWPAEVEALLYRHPAVQEACIIAAKDSYRGETVKAVVVLKPDARGKTEPQTITDWAREHMAAYKVPTQVVFVEALPKSGSGKVMWRLLQEQEARSA
ncbi:acyl-CoA synthetase (AMP-forming)/AMP-acid ligase II [Burkholderiales bacterium JOSHI_001]|nr:acyl-CoA synthetase (AMP-forming)/AMP-acid ligase II [Burkholderiales bacterium JOSHI_001]